jgi:hypothetical protein
MIVLPMRNFRFPRIRILARKKWGGKAQSGSGWQQLPMLPDGMELGGFELIKCSRSLLPQVGRAVLQFSYGQFGNKIIGASLASQNRINSQGGGWDPGSDTLELPNLAGWEIRIQAARQVEDELGSSS